jgi:hypothetical protein
MEIVKTEIAMQKFAGVMVSNGTTYLTLPKMLVNFLNGEGIDLKQNVTIKSSIVQAEGDLGIFYSLNRGGDDE